MNWIRCSVMDKAPARDARGRWFAPRSRHPKMSIFVSHLIIPICQLQSKRQSHFKRFRSRLSKPSQHIHAKFTNKNVPCASANPRIKMYVYIYIYIYVCVKIYIHFQYGTVIARPIFHPNPHKRHPFAHPWGREMGCLLQIISPDVYLACHCCTIRKTMACWTAL